MTVSISRAKRKAIKYLPNFFSTLLKHSRSKKGSRAVANVLRDRHVLISGGNLRKTAQLTAESKRDALLFRLLYQTINYLGVFCFRFHCVLNFLPAFLFISAFVSGNLRRKTSVLIKNDTNTKRSSIVSSQHTRFASVNLLMASLM